MKQSSFHSRPLSLRRLRKQSHAFRPKLKEEGRVERFLLDAFAGDEPLGDTARRLQETFPNRFETWQQALAFAGQQAQRYSD